MMSDSPRIIAIDDEPNHLTGLANGLGRHGMSCLQFHYTGDLAAIKPCPDVRLIFTDLHLGSGVLATDPTTDFSVIGALLEETIKPSGPYLILLWTMYPDQAPALQAFLVDRLRSVTKPAAVLALAKADHLDGDGNIKDEEELMNRVDTLAAAWARPKGALALLGAWSELEDREVDTLIEEIYAARRNDMGRPVELED